MWCANTSVFSILDLVPSSFRYQWKLVFLPFFVLFWRLSSHLTHQHFCNDNSYLTSMVWAREKQKAWSQVWWNVGAAKGQDPGNNRNYYEGTILGTAGTICGHNWNSLWARMEQFLWHCLWGHNGHDYCVCHVGSADFLPYFEILLALTTHSLA